MEASESACHRTLFYVGGTYVDDKNRLGKLLGKRVMQRQMYVERLTPLLDTRHALPLVFIHGGGQTASVRFASGFKSSCERVLLSWRPHLLCTSYDTFHDQIYHLLTITSAFHADRRLELAQYSWRPQRTGFLLHWSRLRSLSFWYAHPWSFSVAVLLQPSRHRASQLRWKMLKAVIRAGSSNENKHPSWRHGQEALNFPKPLFLPGPPRLSPNSGLKLKSIRSGSFPPEQVIPFSMPTTPSQYNP